ncbi:hypothetical protein C8Q74DRAFT_1234771 [Fomes fomentarius]|nr:hypothetical protein C8Q74DRAFT_1234771 [Fomes fomentarius]
MRHTDTTKPLSLQGLSRTGARDLADTNRARPTRHGSTSATTVAEPHMLRDSFSPTYPPMSPSPDTRPTSPADIRHRPPSDPSLPRRTYTLHPYSQYQTSR